MEEQPKVRKGPQILVWIGKAIICFGILMIPLGLITAIGKYLSSEDDLFSSLFVIYDFIGAMLSVCGFGLAITFAKRWHLFALLIIVFLGSFLIGLFSMVGKETNVGYYIWAVGLILSILLIITLYWYWEDLVDG